MYPNQYQYDQQQPYYQQPQYQAFDIQEPHHDKSSSSSSSSSQDHFKSRVKFIRKVYAIISFQLLITTFFSIITFTSTSFQIYQVQNIGLFYVAILLSIIIEISLICCNDVAKQVPSNYILLFLFTLCQSWIVSTVCSIVMLSNKNGGTLVLMAAILTLGITLGLTYYAWTCKTDFTMMGGALFIFSIALLIFGIFLMIFNNKILHIIYVTLGAILYGFYLLYDTQLLIGNRKQKLDLDDYIIGALMIYIDIVYLFIELLQLLTALFGSD